MIYDKIKLLREQKGLTQAELARKLGLTRAGVNAWEMGLSMPSTQYIVELARFLMFLLITFWICRALPRFR